MGQSSLSLSGGAYADAPNAPELNTTLSWTIEAWFRDETPSVGYNHPRARIITKGDTDVNLEVPYFMDIATNQLFVGRRVAGGSQVLGYNLATNGVSHNAWHHVAASFNSATSRLTLYIDGAQVAQSAVLSGVSLGNTNPISIGHDGGPITYPWIGKLDDVRIWNVARTQSEISSNRLSEVAGSPTGLVGNWRFNEGAGATAADSAGTAQDATLQAGAAFSADARFAPPPTATPTATPLETPTTVPPTNTPIPPTETPVPTSTAVPTATSEPTNTAVPTATSVPTNTTVPTATSVPTNTTVPTETSVPTNTAMPTATSTAIPSATAGAPTATQSATSQVIAPTLLPYPAFSPFFVPAVVPVVYPPAPPRVESTPRPQATVAPPATMEPVLLPPPPDSRPRAAVPPQAPAVTIPNAPAPATDEVVEEWLLILRPVQTYTLDMTPLWIAEPGDWYRIARTEGGHALARWEFDVEGWAVWIPLDEAMLRLVRVDADHPRVVSRLWLTTSEPLIAHSMSAEPVAVRAGERYLVLWTDGQRVLVAPDDTSEPRLWIDVDAAVEITLAGPVR